jgi:drug/metabolite transporter (DMT)-like permease
MKLHKVQLAVIAIIIATIIWGAAPPIFKWSLESIQPFTLGFLRFFFASILILPLAAKHLHVAKKHWITLFIIAFVSVPLHIGFFLVGLELAPSINVPIIAAAGPIFVMIFSGRLLKERVSQKIIFGTLISLGGVLVIVIRPIIENGWDGNVLGNFFFLLSTITAVAHLFLLKRIINQYHTATITFWTFFIGQLFFLPMMIWEMQSPSYTFIFNTESFVGIVYGAIFSSGIAWLIHAYAVKYLPASEVSIFAYLDPIITALVAIPLLNETITFSYLLGGTLVFLGIFIAEGRIPQYTLHKLANGFKSII